MTNYKVLQSIVVGEDTFHPGDIVSETDDGRDWFGMIRLKLIEPTSDKASVQKPKEEIVEIPSEPLPESTEDLTTDEKSDTNTRKAIVKEEAKGWLKVYDENGNQLGKATRDQEEAELIKMEYETAPE